jgi:hypothetical protein
VSAGSGTEVTARDIDSGEQQAVTIKDDYNLVTDGDCVVAHIAAYPKSGTHVITIKNVGGAR